MLKTEISRATLGRIPTYIKYLDTLPLDIENISATSIASGLNLGEVQVRKDLAALCGAGKPKIGYRRLELKKCLEHYMDNDNGNAVIIGAGKLGRALLDYGGFNDFGISILAAFDRKTLKAENTEKGKLILPMSDLADFCRKNTVKLGIIAVTAESAQEVCELLYANGILAMWCFAPCRLVEPKGAVIRYENLALSLAHLKMQIE